MLTSRGCITGSLKRKLFKISSAASHACSNSLVLSHQCFRVEPTRADAALLCRRRFSTHSKASTGSEPLVSAENVAIKRIRNVALIAHIDAGKTTTTERMLYCAHRTHHLGEVDRGDTVTDYLPEERARGITIVSSAASLDWRRHTIHLLDTPGHVDFTWEVERCLPVLDAAVTILDGTKGVQAQTRTVGRQAEKYNLPQLIFVNKLDRSTASLQLCLSSLEELGGQNCSSRKIRHVPIHWPVYHSDLVSTSSPSSGGPPRVHKRSSGLVGIVDLTAMTFWDWSNCMHPEDVPTVHDLLHLGDSHPGPSNQQSGHPKPPFTGLSTTSMKNALEARVQLLGQLAELDDCFADVFLTQESPELVLPKESVRSAVRRLTPVLVGSSRCSIGVPSLLDAIVQYLPDPSVRPPPVPVTRLIHHLAGETRIPSEATSMDLWQSALQLLQQEAHHDLRSQPIMLVFKVIFNSHRGPLSLVRVYSGCVRPGCQVSNWSQSSRGLLVERVVNVLQLTGDQQENIESAGPGSIVALTGLQSTHSGDLLGPPIRRGKTSTQARSRQKRLDSVTGSQDVKSIGDNVEEELGDEVDPPNDSMVELFGTKPDPVVYAAVEPASLSVVRPLEQALACMHREDPSFHAKLDTETGQWKIGGMGDLHLEVSISRLQRHYKVDARIGSLLIAYRECPLARGGQGHISTSTTGFSRLSGTVDGRETVVLVQLLAEASGTDGNQVVFDRSCFGHQDSLVPPPSGSQGKLLQIIRTACHQTLECSGPLLRSPVVGVSLHLQHILVGRPSQVPRTPTELASMSTRLPANLYRLPVGSQVALLALLKAAVTSAAREALKGLPEWTLMEPMMRVELQLPLGRSADPLSHFLGDLSARRAEIVSVDSPAGDSNLAYQHRIVAIAPLAELVGYSAAVRTLSSGEADLQLQLVDYRPVGGQHQASLVNRFRWTAADNVEAPTNSDD